MVANPAHKIVDGISVLPAAACPPRRRSTNSATKHGKLLSIITPQNGIYGLTFTTRRVQTTVNTFRFQRGLERCRRHELTLNMVMHCDEHLLPEPNNTIRDSETAMDTTRWHHRK
ncbi:uncharacterized protein LOC117650770 [Thrips palmi]|uniref:Uncharacterized protein LOC117650770 n=1 Tax=Thrips palmi TaxID=161013 RepID=A0A6P8ZXX4_THRPL|nr:uncharacterized protein LOC117650770 [Thrips palmi]